MKNKDKKKILLIITLFIVPMIILHVNIFSQYIEDDSTNDVDQEDVKKVTEKETKKDGTLPPYIAFNIKAIKVPFMNDSIRVSWNISPNYDDEFIIGRAGDIIDTSERVLAAESISVINSRSKNIFIDEGLKPGTYYYVIIARDKIDKKNVELYRDINYTGIPVTIEASALPSNQVSNIFAKVIADNRVLITWGKVPKQGIAYYVYRSNAAIDTGEKVKTSKRVGTVIDGDEFTDQAPGDDNLYYYAVSLKDSDGGEKFVPQQDQNFTTRGIKFVKKMTSSVMGIQAGLLNARDIEVRWNFSGQDNGPEIGGFVVYRSKEIIDSADKLNTARQVNSVQKNVSKFIDSVTDTGSYYYAVFVKFKDGVINISLTKNSNYTTVPVIVSDTFEILSITSNAANNRIEVSWNYSGVPENTSYRIYRVKSPVDTVSKIRHGDIIGKINLRDKKFIDDNPQKGGFYYGLLPVSGLEGFKIKKGVTITKAPVYLKTGKVKKMEQEEDRESGDVDDIINRTFFKGYYRDAIKELKIVMEKTDNETDTAKAILFIGRSWIELGEYEKALHYLVKRELKKKFTNEANFWSEFATIRLKR